MIKYFGTCLLFVLPLLSTGQENPAGNEGKPPKDSEIAYKPKGHTVYARIIDGDTVPFVRLREFSISTTRTFSSQKEAEKWDRLKRDVKKAYPYAKIAGAKLREYNDALSAMESERERKKYLNQKEKEMKAEFENDLKNLTIRQGRILIKLVDRETGNTSYALVKELKGTFSAFMWQSLARMFGSNLKDTYDGTGEDKAIEEIVRLIELGEL